MNIGADALSRLMLDSYCDGYGKGAKDARETDAKLAADKAAPDADIKAERDELSMTLKAARNRVTELKAEQEAANKRIAELEGCLESAKRQTDELARGYRHTLAELGRAEKRIAELEAARAKPPVPWLPEPVRALLKLLPKIVYEWRSSGDYEQWESFHEENGVVTVYLRTLRAAARAVEAMGDLDRPVPDPLLKKMLEVNLYDPGDSAMVYGCFPTGVTAGEIRAKRKEYGL